MREIPKSNMSLCACAESNTPPPSSGLLTEVQCQSKRLRKGGKGRGQEEEENTDSRRVSSTSRLPGQVRHTRARLDAFLTSEFKF